MNLLTLRLGEHHKKKDIFDELIELLKSNKGACDEIWLTTENGFPPMEIHKRNAAEITEAAKAVRDAGIRASLQIGNTIGHGDFLQHLDFSGMAWRKMVGHDGTIANYSSCPRDPMFLDYVGESTREYCVWQPEAVWVDDDLRMQNHNPVKWGCFCEKCIKEFSQIYGGQWTRESLTDKINDPVNWAWRSQWLEFNSSSLALVMEAVLKAVARVSPDSRIGLQHDTWDYAIYSGHFYKNISEVVKRITGKKILSRPGAGYYNDYNPCGMIGKGMIVNLSNHLLEEYADETKPEIESFPHTAMSKTAHGLAVESSLYLAHGSKGLTYAILAVQNERPGFFGNIFKRLANWRPFWERYLEHNKESIPGGIQIYYNGNQFQRPLESDERQFEWSRALYGNLNMMSAFGLPMTFYDKQPAILLHPDGIDGISESELKEIFSGGVITDGEVIEKLNRRGLEYLTGVDAQRNVDLDMNEILTEHENNGQYGGRQWIQFNITGLRNIHRIVSSNPVTHVIGEYINYGGKHNGTASILTETALGGRLAVFGYNFWEPVVNTARRSQIISAADWVSAGNLPVIIETPVRVSAVPRIDRAGKLKSVMLLNASIDHTEEITINIRNVFGEKMIWNRPLEEELALEAVKCPGGYSVKIPSIEPWSVGVLEIHQ